MIGPGRITDPHGGAGPGASDEVGAQPQRAGAAGCLHPGDPVGPGERTKDDGGEQIDKARVTLRPQIGFAALFGQQHRFGRLHRAHHRGRARLVAIDADAQVNLVGARIGAILRDQPQQRVGRLAIERTEQGPAGRRGKKGRVCHRTSGARARA